MYEKSDYDLLYARLINAVDATNEKLGGPNSAVDPQIDSDLSIFRHQIARALDPSETLIAATRFVVSGPKRPLSGILILLADRLFAVWDVGAILIKPHVVVIRYESVTQSLAHWGSGPFEGAVVLDVRGSEDVTVALFTKDPARAQFLVEIIAGEAPGAA